MNAIACQAGLDEVVAILGAFRGKLIEGELVDLNGLDNKVIDLCASIATLPQDQRSSMASQLDSILLDLNQLSAYLRAQADEIAKQVASAAGGDAPEAATVEPGGPEQT